MRDFMMAVRSKRYRSLVRWTHPCNYRGDNREQPRYSTRRVALLVALLPLRATTTGDLLETSRLLRRIGRLQVFNYGTFNCSFEITNELETRYNYDRAKTDYFYNKSEERIIDAK